MKILMVCTGNICRSPLAQGILQFKCQQKGLDWFIDSAGTKAWGFNMPPDKRSITIAKKYGIDISGQQDRSVISTDYDTFDLIYAMDLSNYNQLKKWALDEQEASKIKLIMDEVYPGEFKGVPDPYFDDDGFEKVYDMLNKACDKIIERYSQTH